MCLVRVPEADSTLSQGLQGKSLIWEVQGTLAVKWEETQWREGRL